MNSFSLRLAARWSTRGTACVVALVLATAACGSTSATDTSGGADTSGGGADTALGNDVSLVWDAATDTSAAPKDVETAEDTAAPVDAAETPDVPVLLDVPAPQDVPVVQDTAPVLDVQPMDVYIPPDVPKPDVQTVDTQSAPDVAEDPCPGGVKWLLGDLIHTDLMEPGLACNQCHAKKGPVFAFGGTVYPGFHTVDTCNGVNGVTVEITGADGQVVKMNTNLAGNFHSNTQVKMPYTARVVDSSGKERKMYDPQTEGDCNSCHTEQGTNGAPGRIRAP